MKIRTRRLLLAALWMALIFTLSAQQVLPGQNLFPFADKLAHMIAYGMLAMLLARALFLDGVRHIRQITMVVLLTTLYGMTDEFHQSFVPGRDVSAGDIVADGTGALLVTGVLYWLHARRAMAVRQVIT